VHVVKKGDDLEPTHTYRLWDPVTDAMKRGDMKSGRKRKGKLEQWQREYLKKKEESHKPTYFKKDSSGRWTFDPPSQECQDILGSPVQ
jgi:hypothetical protein